MPTIKKGDPDTNQPAAGNNKSKANSKSKQPATVGGGLGDQANSRPRKEKTKATKAKTKALRTKLRPWTRPGAVAALAAVGLLFIASRSDRESRHEYWESHRALLSFVKTESPSKIPPPGVPGVETFEVAFLFKNREGGNVASGVHVSDVEVILVSPDGKVCDVGGHPPFTEGPRDVGPGQDWNIRMVVSTFLVREWRMSAQVRALIDYNAGTDDEGQSISASLPFCEKMVNDNGQIRWLSCLGEPTPACTRLPVT